MRAKYFFNLDELYVPGIFCIMYVNYASRDILDNISVSGIRLEKWIDLKFEYQQRAICTRKNVKQKIGEHTIDYKEEIQSTRR